MERIILLLYLKVHFSHSISFSNFSGDTVLIMRIFTSVFEFVTNYNYVS